MSLLFLIIRNLYRACICSSDPIKIFKSIINILQFNKDAIFADSKGFSDIFEYSYSYKKGGFYIPGSNLTRAFTCISIQATIHTLHTNASSVLSR